MSPGCKISHHMNVLYIFTVVNLIALLHFSVVNAKVAVYDTFRNETGAYFFDMDAQFGPQLPNDGITGYLLPVFPFNDKTCERWYPAPRVNTSRDAKWIALIQRNGRCKFDEMVYMQQVKGYSAVIVYNFKNDDHVVTMGGAQYASLVNISSVFVGYYDGRMLFDYKFEKLGRYNVILSRSSIEKKRKMNFGKNIIKEPQEKKPHKSYEMGHL